MDEIMKALKPMKIGKAAGYERVSSEILRGGGRTVVDLLYELFNKCLKSYSCLYDLKGYECGLRMDELFVKCLLYADDQVILASSACGLQ
ncbi:hypothetical protein EVAR_28285_1 [Eumeta japonica]|uniref:Reverse transcriptase domain-containing protein n=1 Tax=Eumeta variegata TaxID=151549 RepID=A0A4C1V889_EUMVA|nr:hypothetical protein EVAR_28285_1 [Eumeta japonica]